ncbi:AAA family ATPase [Pontibacillus salipaludis]|uniref:AAA domain-containing protein n=1 Tax=Pontibacillus salipaludis TaxID=1697394 RepID=A0ABQ1Q9J7_9BACI|nr:AAA family ATPase [Pontibacillus salipaludis]GGD20207.1 hypothetical protein GCM10011389_29820 [Pontibacillus salipaludis]
MSRTHDIFLIGNNETLEQAITDQLKEEFQFTHLSSQNLSYELKKHVVELAVVLNTDNESSSDLIQTVLSEFPKAFILYIDNESDFDLLREITRLGVSDYLVFPEEESVFRERIHMLSERLQSSRDRSTENFRRGGGKIFSFYSGQGGTGKSLIGSSFAQALKLESTANVLFIDLNTQYGGAETYLNVSSNRSLIDLLPVIQEINEHHIRNIATSESYSNLDVLISPRDAELAEKIGEDFVVRLLRACKRNYDFIIVDLPTWMEERTYTALSESDRIFYMISLDTAALRILKNVEDLFKQLAINTDEKLELVINFSGRENELTKKDLERFVTYPVAAKLRRDIKGVQAAVNQGAPLRKEAKEKKLTPVSKDIQGWVRSMLK